MINKISSVRTNLVSYNTNLRKDDNTNLSLICNNSQTATNRHSKAPSFTGGFFTSAAGFISKAFSGLGAAATFLGGILKYVVPHGTIKPGKFADFPLYDNIANFAAANDAKILICGIGLLVIGFLASIFHSSSTRGVY